MFRSTSISTFESIVHIISDVYNRFTTQIFANSILNLLNSPKKKFILYQFNLNIDKILLIRILLFKLQLFEARRKYGEIICPKVLSLQKSNLRWNFTM